MKNQVVLSEDYVRKMKTKYAIGVNTLLLIVLVRLVLAWAGVCTFQVGVDLILVAIGTVLLARRDSLLENHKIHQAIAGPEEIKT